MGIFVTLHQPPKVSKNVNSTIVSTTTHTPPLKYLSVTARSLSSSTSSQSLLDSPNP